MRAHGRRLRHNHCHGVEKDRRRAGELHVSLEQLSVAGLGTTDMRSDVFDLRPLLLDCLTQSFDQPTVDTIADEQSDDAVFQGFRCLSDYAESRRGFNLSTSPFSGRVSPAKLRLVLARGASGASVLGS